MAFQAELLRYCLVLWVLLMMVTTVVRNFDSRQFDRLLSMPISRWQYVVACFAVVLTLAFNGALVTFLTLAANTSMAMTGYWTLALMFELVLVGTLALLAALSIEKITSAVFLTVSMYLLSRSSEIIQQMLNENIRLTDGSMSSNLLEQVFSLILYVLPADLGFANNDLLFSPSISFSLLIDQAFVTIVYSLLILCVCLIDFYRKEFNI